MVKLQVNAVNIWVIMGYFSRFYYFLESVHLPLCHRLTAVDILRLDEHVRGKQQAYVSGNETHLFSTFVVFCNWCVVLCGVAERERLSKQGHGYSCHLAASKTHELWGTQWLHHQRSRDLPIPEMPYVTANYIACFKISMRTFYSA
jgi:hypothetical protein